MGSYKVVVKRSVAKDLRRLPKKQVEKILERLAALAAEPRPRGAEKLRGQEKYRIRHAVYRIIYEINDDQVVVVVVKVGHRRDVYDAS